ncbi:MAG: hypothetical protein LBU43_12405, partial [Candidatus Accumulibacter sp.]|nr:hypothetical protein [Accumulibacter sp.]
KTPVRFNRKQCYLCPGTCVTYVAGLNTLRESAGWFRKFNRFFDYHLFIEAVPGLFWVYSFCQRQN